MTLLAYQKARPETEAEHRKTSPENKRLLSERGESDHGSTEPTKRRKMTEVTLRAETSTAHHMKETIDGVTKKVDPTELASAFALASLASLSPGGSSVGSVNGTPPRESRELITARKESMKDEVRKAASFESETRSPQASEHPLSPEQRSQEDSSSTSMSSPSRRVSFAPNTKPADPRKNTPATPTSAKAEEAVATPSRQSLAMPHESPRGSNMQMSPRPHRMYGGRGLPPFVRTPPQHHQRMGYGAPPPPPHAPYHHRLGLPVSFRHGPPPMHQHMASPFLPQQFGYGAMGPRHLPPRQLMQPPLMHRTNSSGMGADSNNTNNNGSNCNNKNNQWICDYCNVASFSSYEEACAHEEICKKSGPKAAAALRSMTRSYSAASMDEDSSVSMTSMPMMHHFPPHMHPGFGGAMEAARLHHHASMALKMGHQQHHHRVMDENSIRKELSAASAKGNNSTSRAEQQQQQQQQQQQPMTEEERQRQELHLHSLGGYIVYPKDLEMIPPYVHFLMRQVEPCLFTEADRFVARSKGPVGYPGFQCRHCNGHAGLGKYFPISSKSLSTNSTSQNIHAHMLKCQKCPEAVKEQLVQLKIEKSRAARLEPGWRKVFFDKVWKRLHPEADGSDESK